MNAIAEGIHHVLIIDDNDIDALIESKLLKNHNKDIHITSFLEAKEALEYLRDSLAHPEDLPDLILLDLYMPLMNGWLFLHEYKQITHQFRKKIILIVASCTTYDKDLRQIQKYSEIDGYVSKPLTLQKIKSIQEKHFTY